MKELHGSASASVAAPMQACFALVEAVDRYPSWYPDVVREAEVLERDGDGHPTTARATLHASLGPLVRDFRLSLAVTVEEFTTVRLTRIPHDGSDQERFDVTWHLQAGAETLIGQVNERRQTAPSHKARDGAPLVHRQVRARGVVAASLH